jgi:hypothetical protein
LTRGVAGERRRRTGGGAAAGARIPTKTGTEQVNVLHGQLHWGLGSVLRWLVGSGDEREAEPVDGCPAAAAGEITPASWQLEQTNKRAPGATRGPKGVGSSTCWRGKAGGGGAHREASMADGGGSVLARGRTGRLYSRAQGGWGRFSCAPREPSQGVGRGMAGVRREGAATTCGVYAGAWLVGRRGVGTAALRPMDARHVALRERAGMVVPRRMDRRVGGCLGVRTRGGRGERARRDTTSCSAALWLKTIPSTLLRIEFSQIFQTELHQGLTTKLAHLTTPYKFCKGSRVLDQRIWHKLQGNLTVISAPVNSESRL